MTQLDDHGQPLIRALNARRIADRGADELIGIARGVIFDGIITDGEAQNVLRWMEANAAAVYSNPLAAMLYARLDEMMRDGVLDLDEQRELMDLLVDFTGGGYSSNDQAVNRSARLPLDDPQPQIFFVESSFCFTGRFCFGTRNQCQAAVSALGGLIFPRIRQDLRYLVIGDLGSTDWAHSTHGRKIEQAMEYRSAGLPLAIISEEHWTRHLMEISHPD